MKLIIAGGRDYKPTDGDIVLLNQIKSILGVTEVVSGGASGADQFGENWAKQNSIPITHFPADWSFHGKKAGPLRNTQMAAYADAVVLFPGGAGTADMRRQAKAFNLRIIDLS